MSNVIRLRDLVVQLETFDAISLKGELYYGNTLEIILVSDSNPLVHIDLVEEDYEEGPGDERYSTHIIYVTIV